MKRIHRAGEEHVLVYATGRGSPYCVEGQTHGSTSLFKDVAVDDDLEVKNTK